MPATLTMGFVTEDNSPGATKPGRFSTSAMSDELEAAVRDIRGSGDWIQRLVDKVKDIEEHSQQSQTGIASPTSDRGSTDGQEMCGLVSQICLVSQPTEYSSDSRRLSLQLSMFTPSKDSEHLSSVDLEVRSFDPTERAIDRYKPVYMLRVAAIGLVQIALIAFIAALRLTLKSKADSLLAWHPILMCAVLVVLTEATLFVQHMPWAISPDARRLGYKAYSAVQWCAAATCAASILACVRGYSEARRVRGLGPVHRSVGFVAILALTVQLWLDSGTTCCTGTLGVALKSKRRRKWSQALGYIALILMWASAWLGVHSKWLRDGNIDREQVMVAEWTWFAIFAVLVVGIGGLADLSKLGFN
ncbi:hypothetical protein GGI19_005931 [Coemansia pectinata]|uniref:Cytochrome b561 domain-containing protein n=1 Tax=Coemansia pectinata TaxID=1052879 RepID=A0A9W8GQA6_9FUNG|nr:hypothetical protein GGI19_005931 [Coemansia pectinata]